MVRYLGSIRSAIESLLKRRFFVVHMLFVAIAAILCAKIVTNVASHMLSDTLKDKLVASQSKRAPRPTAKPPINRDFDLAADINIFNGKREQLVPSDQPVVEQQMPTGDDCSDAPKSTLRLRLVGTSVFVDPSLSLASIVDEGKGGVAMLYSSNECVSAAIDPSDPDDKLRPKPDPCESVGDGARLRRIEAERVCLWNETDSRMEYLALNEPPDKGPPMPKVDKKSGEPAEEVSADIKKTGENSYEVGQNEVDKALNNISELATQVRVVPAFEGGKTVGFKVFSIRPGSLFSKIGLQNGDVITRINGYDMSSPEKGLEIYGKLKDSKQINVEMKRRGKPQTLDYAIAP